MPYTRDQVVAGFKRRFNQCDDSTAQDLLYRTHNMVCVEIPIATAIAKIPFTTQVPLYRVQASNFDDGDYAANDASGDVLSVARVLGVWTYGYTTDSQVAFTSADQMDAESWRSRVPNITDGEPTSDGIAPTRCWVDFPWFNGVSSQSPYVFSMSFNPIPVFTSGTRGVMANCQVVSDITASGDYIPSGLMGPDVHIDGMCYLYSKEADRQNTGYWLGLYQNTLKQEKWLWANRTRYQSNVYPAGYNLRDRVV